MAQTLCHAIHLFKLSHYLKHIFRITKIVRAGRYPSGEKQIPFKDSDYFTVSKPNSNYFKTVHCVIRIILNSIGNQRFICWHRIDIIKDTGQ